MGHVRKQMITFFMTTQCNLRCKYCYTHKIETLDKKDQALDFNFAKRGINDFFRDNASRHIRFYGIGEPTLEFELMKKIRDYAYEQAGESLVVELQTNGVFSDEVAEWVEQNVDILWMSCDGPAEIHNLHRPTAGGQPTAAIVEKSLRRFAKHPTMQAGARVTLSALSMNKQTEIVDFFHDLGVKYVNVLPAFTPIDNAMNELFKWEPLEFAENFLKAHNKAKELGIWYNTMFIVNFDEPTRHACRSCTPNPHLTTDGYVSTCDFTQLGPEYSPGPLQQLMIGKYIPAEDRIVYDEKAIAKVRARCAENLLENKCKGCEYVYNCAGGCMGQVVNETGDLMGIWETNCVITKYLAERMTRNDKLHPALHS